MSEEDHQLVMFDNSKDLGNWYDQKYTEMGGGWKCGEEEARRLLSWAGISLFPFCTLLDIGSGDGDFIKGIAGLEENAVLWGIDLSEVGINFANAMELKNAIFQKRDIEENGFSDKNFDFLTSVGSIEHVIHLPHALKECYRILKDDGIFMCMVPNELWLYLDQPQEQTHTDEEWSKLFIKAGFKVADMVRRNDLTDFKLVK